ncbi:MAG: hypothetical protein IT436_11890 [Phycisphaerales bacterium]|nr:hypothetical protein [Phycisphaerales bacterium]
MTSPALVLASLVVGPVQFAVPGWLLLIPVLGGLSAWWGRKSLAGLGPVTRWTALAVRLLVITALAAAVAEPEWRKVSKDVAVTVVMDASQSVPGEAQSDMDRWVEAAAQGKGKDDRLGVVTIAKDAYVQSLPSRLNTLVERQHIGATDGSNLAGGVRLGMAVMPEDAANRMLLISDGNETAGSLLQQAEAARAAGIPIDVLPITYSYPSEVIVDRVVAPAAAREFETVNVRVVLNATRPTQGRLSITQNGQALDLDPDSPSLGQLVDLKAGPNVFSVPIPGVRRGPQQFEAIFEPLSEGGRMIGDVVTENNRAGAVTFVSGEGQVLLVAESEEEVKYLRASLDEAKISSEWRPADRVPATLTEMNAYDAIILMNEPAYNFSQAQQEDLRRFVHDSGGGLVMVGGPDTFGAGGWIGSPLEDALPVKLDPPQKREMPKGALALILHSIEMPEGVFYGKEVAKASLNALSRLDLFGMVEYSGAGISWVHPLSEVGDGTVAKRSIERLQFGDMPDYQPAVQRAYDGLSAAKVGQRHCIIISDGDASPPSRSLLQKFVDAKITISTIEVFPHSMMDTNRLEAISKFTGGRHYAVNTQAGLAKLPQIFIKEAQTVKRSLIWEGDPFSPRIIAGASDGLRGITAVPPVRGYVVAADREGLALVTMRGKENDPVLAQWQYGLGKAIAMTTDATSRWAADWVRWPGFRAFWEQHTRWVMRPGGSANVRVTTESRGDQTVIVIDALDQAGERMNFAQFKGRLALPDGTGQDVEFKQVGPGRYEAITPTDKSGSYVLNVRYVAPGKDGGNPIEGNVLASLNRPFADEFRALEDNSALLKQVAAMTGGRVLGDDPARSNLWLRDGLKMPVATRPIWLAVAMAGLALFLIDVGVRRVRIDLVGMARALRRAASRSKARTGEQLGSLKAAREQARQKMARRGDGEAAADVSAESARASAAAVKFEATRAKQAQAPLVLDSADKPPPAAKPAGKPAGPAAPGAPGEGLSRLKSAKQRARDEMDKDNPPAG